MGTETHSLLAYPLETIVAEKLAAALDIGEGNTRLKDFYDLYWILEHETMGNDSLAQAFKRTFTTRETPGERRQALKRLDSTRAQAAWTAFLRGSPVEAPALFSEVLESILNKVGDLLED